MLNSHSLLQRHEATKPFCFLSQPSFLNQSSNLFSISHNPRYEPKKNAKFLGIRIDSASNKSRIFSVNASKTSEIIEAKAVVRVKLTGLPLATSVEELFGKTIVLELVSTQLDPVTGSEKGRIIDEAERIGRKTDEVIYECVFKVPKDFGTVGAILVQNEYANELFVEDVVLRFPDKDDKITFTCKSWVNLKDNRRIFFSDKVSYLPSDTPEGLKKLRRVELDNLKGINRQEQGEFKPYERVYDYDVYNDLGNPDKSPELGRPVLGGKDHPYPRRGKTGRPRSKSDALSEKRASNVYVPRDEEFSKTKDSSFNGNVFQAVIPSIIPRLDSVFDDPLQGFPHFKAIDKLFEEGVSLPKFTGLKSLIPKVVKYIAEVGDDVLQFEAPDLLLKDRFAWISDEEFARQTLAGLNPYSIQLVEEWPMRSKLDPKIYGPADSLITTELVQQQIGGIISIDEAFRQNRLFVLDYHDLFLPYVNKIRELENVTFYGSRTLFFLNDDNTLRIVAIELTRPPLGDKPTWREVFTRSSHGTGAWLWRLAKAHVCAHDAGYHQLVIHWLRTHCCMEPYIIASKRQLSRLHPIYRLLRPHFRYTMEINARARENLINADGIVETTFSPGKYSMEISSAIYDKLWRFDKEALPADLIRRGMATPNSKAEHGVDLRIKDYPFANDGLILWDAIKQWVTDYVTHYYKDDTHIKSDPELQAWWTEVRTKGHADKKDEPWWPVLNSHENLIQTLTTIMWVASGHHAAVNFGQYMYGGYFPNRPTITRQNMPTENKKDLIEFLDKPEAVLLKSFPSQKQATQAVITLALLSSHSPDEEFIGENGEPSWVEDPVINAAYERFQGRMYDLAGVIDERNTNLELKNRTGAGVVKYELLKPFHGTGDKKKGVPNSVSI